MKARVSAPRPVLLHKANTMSPLDRATSLSRFLSRLLDARPELRREVADSVDHPFGAAEMAAWLAAQAPDEPA